MMNSTATPPAGGVGGSVSGINDPAYSDSALDCLVMLARFHHVAADPAHLRHEFSADGKEFGITELLLAAKKLGLKARHLVIKPERLAQTPLPAIACDHSGNYFILARLQDTQSANSAATDSVAAVSSQMQVLIHDPHERRPQLLSIDEFLARWTGQLILIATQHSLAAELSRFDFTWFIPSVVKYRKLLGEVLLASFVLQLFALVTPLFFQVVMDKVLVHHGLTTLDVIAFGLLVVSIFEVVLTALRSYVFSHTASRIDVELGAKLFRHLLALPTAWFGARRVGDAVARVRELENIRSFLTGNVITLLLDVVFSIVFIAVMLYYSGWLTLVVLISLPCYALVSAMSTPILRARLHEKFNRGAENQAFLVETVSAMDTVKSMAVEPQFTKRWDHQLAGYVAAAFRTNVIANYAHNAVDLIGKLVTVATLWLGAKLVIEGKLTVGQLIAFNMLSGRVAQPIMRLAQLWTDFQQVGISMQRLGDVLNTPVEAGSSNRMSLPPIAGRVEFHQVTFRYRPDGAETLRDISFVAESGQVFGLVGRSGSGKSTLAKLIQRLYVPERGRILVDGVDLALADPVWLRRQIGVVLQENILFNRSIRDNIALSDPGAPLEAVIEVAKLSGAHDFILELANGYDTEVGEHGSTLSGGQRQRIAIARALLTRPRILIFDEATSALDYESERIIQDNMQAICKGRTVFIIAHRLSAVRNADRILVMERGQLAESGTHQELLQNANGIYTHLYNLQQS